MTARDSVRLGLVCQLRLVGKGSDLRDFMPPVNPLCGSVVLLSATRRSAESSCMDLRCARTRRSFHRRSACRTATCRNGQSKGRYIENG
jgi:hypothetical protein